MAIFLTGATGFLGTEVTAELLRTNEDKIYVLVRSQNEEEAAHRLRAVWLPVKELYREIGGRIVPVPGDFTEPDLGLAPEIIGKMKGCITRVFHIGAETGIQKSKEELMRVNVEGTRHVLDFARKVDDKGSLERFIFVSTAYTAGAMSGRIMENDPRPGKYNTYYEMSKARAEKLVMQSGLPYTIGRPGMIVGNSETGRIRNFNTVYYVLKLMLQGKMQVFPVSAAQKLNIVPVDYVSNALVRLSYLPEAENACFHLTPPEDRKPTAGELAKAVLTFSKEELGVRLARPVFISMPALKKGRVRPQQEDGGERAVAGVQSRGAAPVFL